MKLAKVLTVAAVAMVAMSHSAYANNAKFQKIERQLNNCANQAYSGGGHNLCIGEALEKYQAAFTKSQKNQYEKRAQMCAAKFGDPIYLSEFEAAESLDCMHKAAKAVSKRK